MDKLAYFRIKELKHVLTQLGLSKQGKKQDLVDRIVSVLSDEQGTWAKKNAVGKDEVIKLVNETYSKMQAYGPLNLDTASLPVSESRDVKRKDDKEDSYQMEKIRCLCGSSLATDSMIKCEDPRCNVWQHMACVLIPEKPMESVLPNPPDIFFCEICRLNRADPFWVTVAHPLQPVKLNITSVPTDSSNPNQSIEKTFQLTRADRDLLSKQEYDVQAWCMLLNDKVTFRMQWPQYTELQINGVSVRAINRPGSQMLGTHGRDDGPIITPCTRDGINKIYLAGVDARIFCVGVRLVKKRSLHQVLNMIPKEGEGERFEEALARVRRCVGGGNTTENADSDSDIEVVADCISVSLRCPMSGLRMKVAGRFSPCAHMGCFDLEVFVEMNQRSRKWQCPICLTNYSLEKIIIDPYFNRIISKFQHCEEDVTEIDVKPDGSWRAKAEGDRKSLGELGLWHLPDGTICPQVEAESKPKIDLQPVKQELGSDNHAGLRLGMKKNQDGFWEINKPYGLQGIPSANRFDQNNGHIIPMSSSATGSGRDWEDGSVNQDGGGNLDYSAVNGVEYESLSMNIDTTHGFSDRTAQAPTGNAELIVLSDSEDEIEPPLLPSGAVYKNSGIDAAVPHPDSRHGLPDSFYENPGLGNAGNSCLDLYNPNDDDLGINMWSLPSGSQGGPSFQLFGSDVDVADALVDMQHGPLNSSSINGYTMTAEMAMGSAALVPEPPAQQSHSDMNDGLVDNPLAFNGQDPALKIFLPTRPFDASAAQSNTRDHPEVVSNGIGGRDDWISLRLGDGVGSGQGETMAPNGLDSRQHLQSRDGGALGSFDDDLTASLSRQGTKENRSGKIRKERSSSDSPFSFARKGRPVKQKLYLSIDSDTE
ncbi:E3 SUMO-protein ligase SIZ1-like isoform X2 [Andrographis paniculata]|uniref:E3 SUMO-protein ligase SIZ1-like isoform X2 n=1 Tax=Andrographis paniculata TaxID=175694 RepID=UPI0021E8A166|nr:E3 SUMO-protein ligase SIZ1-like isoform X2 [Andrographis paniculata]